ncbi:MAG: hypothetical protein WC310_03635 [Patescibacteria group bacterium]|jgi:hypothetical protein
MKIAICGSMVFATKMMEVRDFLTTAGQEVVLPANVDKYANNEMTVENKWEKLELDVIKRYYNEIRQADAILVVNESKNGTENYVGGNSLIEMAFAHVLDKKNFFTQFDSYWDELC